MAHDHCRRMAESRKQWLADGWRFFNKKSGQFIDIAGESVGIQIAACTGARETPRAFASRRHRHLQALHTRQPAEAPVEGAERQVPGTTGRFEGQAVGELHASVLTETCQRGDYGLAVLNRQRCVIQ